MIWGIIFVVLGAIAVYGLYLVLEEQEMNRCLSCGNQRYFDWDGEIRTCRICGRKSDA